MSGHNVLARLILSGHFCNLSGHACHSHPILYLYIPVHSLTITAVYITFSSTHMRRNQPRGCDKNGFLILSRVTH